MAVGSRVPRRPGVRTRKRTGVGFPRRAVASRATASRYQSTRRRHARKISGCRCPSLATAQSLVRVVAPSSQLALRPLAPLLPLPARTCPRCPASSNRTLAAVVCVLQMAPVGTRGAAAAGVGQAAVSSARRGDASATAASATMAKGGACLSRMRLGTAGRSSQLRSSGRSWRRRVEYNKMAHRR
jgi:hypothetical protein